MQRVWNVFEFYCDELLLTCRCNHSCRIVWLMHASASIFDNKFCASIFAFGAYFVEVMICNGNIGWAQSLQSANTFLHEQKISSKKNCWQNPTEAEKNYWSGCELGQSLYKCYFCVSCYMWLKCIAGDNNNNKNCKKIVITSAAFHLLALIWM